MNQRFFRSNENIYEAIRLQLDSIWGHGPGTGTDTCYEPAITAPRDNNGLLLLAVHEDFCEYEAVANILPNLLATRQIEEITEQDYMENMSKFKIDN